MLKRHWIGIAVGVLSLALIASPALGAGPRVTASGTPRQGEWRGRTDQRSRLIFDVVETRRGRVVQPVDVEVLATCQETGDQIDVGFGGGQKVLQPDGSFRFRFSDPFFGSFTFSGILGKSDGSGTVSFSLAALIGLKKTQLCTSGDVGWSASAPGTTSTSTSPAHREPDYMVRFSQDRSGHLTWTVTKG
jgi:hypothetical protein